MINLLLANDCKLNCVYCYQKSKHDKRRMSVDYVSKVFNRTGNEVYHLFGGEPFSNKEAIDYISDNVVGKDIRITTNVIETDITAVVKMAKKETLKKIRLSLGVLGANDRYDKETQKKVFDKVEDILNALKDYRRTSVELHFVFMKKDFHLMYENYKFFSEMIIKIKKYATISYCLNVDEEKSESDLDVVFVNYKKILDFDYKNFKNVMFYSFKPREFVFCKGENEITHNIDYEFKGCPVSIYETKNNMEKTCLDCKNDFCAACVLNSDFNCGYYKRLQEFVKKEIHGDF
ncbi:MAG: radical SAM protein [Paraclostridium sp.]